MIFQQFFTMLSVIAHANPSLIEHILIALKSSYNQTLHIGNKNSFLYILVFPWDISGILATVMQIIIHHFLQIIAKYCLNQTSVNKVVRWCKNIQMLFKIEQLIV